MLLPLLTLVAYALPLGAHVSYDASVKFDGYLPILGGHSAKAEVAMVVEVAGLAPSDTQNGRASSEITTLSLVFNGAKMPFTADNVKEIFPKTTVEFSPFGKVVKSDAPNGKLPFRLPGLDPKRFPDITYMPLEFPASGIEVGKPFKFSKTFGDAPVDYTVTPSSISGDVLTCDIKLSQSYTTFEDQHRNTVEESAAASKITTTVTGAGSSVFDLKRGLVKSLNLVADAASHVVNLTTKVESDRQLKTTLKVDLRN